MKGRKLIRDGLASRIPAAELSVADPSEMDAVLEAKLAEELAELRDSGFSDPAEFGDVLEVLLAIAARRGLTASDLEAARTAKLAARGGFADGLVWTPSG